MSGPDMNFLKAFLRRPHVIGSIVPSSRALALKMAEQIELHPQSRVAEIGPGTGAITRVLLERLTDPSQYFGVDINPDFVEHLRSNFPKAKFVAGSAEKLDEYLRHDGGSKVDDVVSSLPWTIFPIELRNAILASVERALTEVGTFTTFTYVQSLVLPSSRNFLQQMLQHFEEVRQSPIVWKNLPPAVVFHCRRPRK